MIWDSIALMTIFDVVIFSLALASLLVIVTRRGALVESNLFLPASIIVVGLFLIGLFYISDLFIMWILPVFVTLETSMAVMEDLHLNYSWINILVVMVCIVTGFSLMVRKLLQQGTELRSANENLRTEFKERKRAEETLRESEARYKAILEAKPDLMFQLSEDGVHLDFYASSLDELYLDPKTFMGKSVDEVLPPDVGEKFKRSIRETLKTSQMQEFEYQLAFPDGVRHYECRMVLSGANKTLAVVREITEHKRAEAALRASEVRFRRLIEHAPEAVVLLDMKADHIIQVNPAAERLFKLPAERLCQCGILDLSPPTQPDGRLSEGEIRRVLDRVCAGETPLVEWTHRDAEGRDILCEVRLLRLEIDGRTVIRGSITDITERKQAEIALRQSEENLRITLYSIGDAVIAVDVEGLVVCMNPVAENLTGWALEDAQGKTLTEVFNIVNAQTKESAVNPVKRVFESGKIVGLANHTMLIAKDGAEHQIADSGAPIRDAEGNITGVVLVFRDVTEEYKTQEALRKAKNYISNIIDSMPSVVIGVDPEGKVTEWNREAQRAMGVPAAEAVGKPLAQAFPRLAAAMGRVREAMQTREVRSDPRQARNVDGETRYEDVTVYPLVSNGIEGAVIRVDDVTERVRIEEMMVQSEKMLSVGGLAAGMAHEINNPLAGMMQTASVMSSRLTNPELGANRRAAEQLGTSMDVIGAFMALRDIPKMLRRISESGSRVAEIVSNMLSFARKSDASASSHDLARLLDQSVALAGSDYDLKKNYDFRQIEIVREYQENLPPLLCEPSKIQQVLLNILRNGAEAMQEGKGRGKGEEGSMKAEKPRFILRLAHEQRAGRVRLEIEDNGPGMDEETRKRIFEPFFTTKSTERGTGLGLSVSYFIITENHGGEMSVESIPGAGTTFIISLPVERRGS